MAGYLVRRFFQMIIVVLLSTMAIYMLLNIAPGGPLSGLKLATGRERVSDADIARLEAYLGLDKPLALRYLTWLIGDDWLGADWMYLGLTPYEAPRLDAEGNKVISEEGYRPCVLDKFRDYRAEQIAQLVDPAVLQACETEITVDEAGVEDKSQYWTCMEKEFRAYRDTHDVPEGAVVECSGPSDEREACREAALPQEQLDACDATRQVQYLEPRRFWADPGVARLDPGDTLWVWGPERETDVFEAERIVVNSEEKRPDDAVVGKVLDQKGREITLESIGGRHQYTILTDSETEFGFSLEEARPRPEDGTWLNVSWLFGADGLLGQYAGFHGTQKGVLRLDWGTSWKLAAGQPVLNLIRSRLGNTILLMTTAAVLSLVVAIPIGIYSAVNQYSKVDYVVSTFAFFGISLPVFWFGLMMILLFAHYFKEWGEWQFPIFAIILPAAAVALYRLRSNVQGQKKKKIDNRERLVWIFGTIIATGAILLIGLGPKFEVPLLAMPSGGTTSKRPPDEGTLLYAINATPGGLMDRVVHIIMPAIVLSLLYMAQWSRFMRSSMLEVLRQDYVRTARAKGLRERAVIAKHALRNALIPIITIVVFQLPNIFGGATLTETIFSYPGIGRLLFTALVNNDWPIMMVILFITAILVVIATLLGDILYTLVDPRIRYS